jgi:hypothetical protein
MIDATLTLATIAMLGLTIWAVGTAAHKLIYRHRSNRLPILSEWKCRKNAAPLTSAFTRITEHEPSPGPVPVARDHRGSDRA